MINARERTPKGAQYTLTPSQQRAYDAAVATIPGSALTVIQGDVGMGKSLVVQHLQAHFGGTIWTLREIMAEVARRDAGHVEEALIEFILRAFEREDIVFLEDVTIFDGLGSGGVVDRPLYLPHVMAATYEKIRDAGLKLVITTSDEHLNDNLKNKGAILQLDGLGGEDYFAIIRNRAGALPTDFDFDKVGRVFKKLTGHQIGAVMNLLRHKGNHAPTADDFIDGMDSVKARSNLVVEDVEDVTLDGLVGIEEATRELMRTVVIPMTQPELARELGLQPARGILLHGEPGTGKTTIGRALARQMKGKFFIMDGSTPPGGADSLLAAAEASSPSIFFIDDADVIFKDGANGGFARKLLTKLDGLESESIGNVCIMMTAMDVSDMPPAIVRSGRVEVWLHMSLPDDQRRIDIINHYAKSLPEEMRQFDEEMVIAATVGFVPADLRGLVGDARGHIAFERHKGRPAKSFEYYLIEAAMEIQNRKAVLAMLAGKQPIEVKLPRERVDA
jgi:transitional endoplasmic reticulum ATPase